MARDTRQTLIDAAYELFGRQGFHLVGLDRILADAGVSKQTFYNHFESKDDLILAVLEQRHEVESRTIHGLFDKLAGDDPRARLYATFDVMQAWFDLPEFRGCIFLTAAAEFPTPHDPAHQSAAAHERSIVENFEDLATRAGARDPRALAEQLALLVEGIVAYRHVTADPRTVDIARQTGKLLLDAHLPAPRQLRAKRIVMRKGAVAPTVIPKGAEAT
jgi:AcrR family transcriptional regulator